MFVTYTWCLQEAGGFCHQSFYCTLQSISQQELCSFIGDQLLRVTQWWETLTIDRSCKRHRRASSWAHLTGICFRSVAVLTMFASTSCSRSLAFTNTSSAISIVAMVTASWCSSPASLIHTCNKYTTDEYNIHQNLHQPVVISYLKHIPRDYVQTQNQTKLIWTGGWWPT